MAELGGRGGTDPVDLDKVQYILQYLIMGLRNMVGRQKISKRTYGYEMDQLLKMSFHCVSQPGLEALSLSL